MRCSRFVVVALAVCACALANAEFVIVDSGAPWSYSPNEEVGWATPGFDDGGWAVGSTPFDDHTVSGWCDFGGDGTHWPLNSTLYLRKRLELKQADDVVIRMAIDNDADVYFDGQLVASVRSEGCPFRWQYEIGLPAVPPGEHVVAAMIVDRGDDNGFDMMVAQSHTPLAQPLGDADSATMSGKTIGQCVFGGYCDRGFSSTRAHSGVDYAAAAGTPVYAICDGVVILARTQQLTPNIRNRFTLVDHSGCGFGGMFGYYGHVDATVKKGKVVAKGQQIGVVASWVTEGGADNSHLHLGINAKYLTAGWGYAETGVSSGSDCLQPSVSSRRDALAALEWLDPVTMGTMFGWKPSTLKGGSKSGSCNAVAQPYIPIPIGTSLPWYPWIAAQ